MGFWEFIMQRMVLYLEKFDQRLQRQIEREQDRNNSEKKKTKIDNCKKKNLVIL